MSQSFTCSFSLPHPKSNAIKNALEIDENKDQVIYKVQGNVLHIEIQSDDYRSLMKTSKFFMERYKLVLETISLCEEDEK